MLTGCIGARTGLREPVESAITFRRAVGSGFREIYQVSPSGTLGPGRVRVGGVNALSHDVDISGDWTAYSTPEGLFVDWRGSRTQRSVERAIAGIRLTPDARRLAFSQRDRIWVMNSVGSGAPTPLTPEYTDTASQQAATTPAWTPEAGRLYFIRYRSVLDSAGHPIPVRHEIWTIAADGSDLRLVRAGSPEASQPGLAVSRDGAVLLYATGFEASPSIIQLDLASGATSPLIANASQPAFSATGRALAFVRNGRVWVCTYDGSTCVNERPVSNGTNDQGPSWVGG